MRAHYLVVSLAIVFSISLQANGQPISISGTVVDIVTQEPIPFVSIGSINAAIGTSSNIAGEFSLKVDSLPMDLVFSHLNYEKRSIRVLENNPIVLELTPATKVLDAITVKGRKRSGYIENLVQKAYYNVRNQSKSKYGRAFYRQVTKTDTVYSELYEIFYDTRFDTEGILDWEIQEGRYAIGNTIIANKNFSLLSKIWTTIQPPTDDFIMPINRKLQELYEYEIKEVIERGPRKLAVVHFTPIENVGQPAFEGDVYIDIDNYDILKVAGSIKDDRIKFIKLTSDEGYWKNYKVDYELTYRDDVDSTLILDYINVEHTFDYYLEDEFQFPVTTQSLLTFYDFYQPLKRKRLGGKIRLTRDADILDHLGYNSEFWQENEIVKRTPVEQEVIEAFESQKAFGTIYLNNQKQIVLERNDLLTDPMISELEQKFDKTISFQEKAYLHLDKPYYMVGEDIWFSPYLVDGHVHRKSMQSEVLYSELIGPDQEVVSHKILEIKEGLGAGDFALADTLPSGKYEIRAYTSWMRNFSSNYFFSQYVDVYNAKSKPPPEKELDELKVNFFPEGGDLVKGVISRVGFKAVDSQGKGVPVKGTIHHPDGNQVGVFSSNHLGIGSFFIHPQTTGYFIKLKQKGEDKTYPLPDPVASGFSIQVTNNKPNAMKVSVTTSEDLNESGFYLIGQCRGRIYYKGKGLIEENRAAIEIPKSNLPNGILQITLFDEQGRPQCERLTFVNNQRNVNVAIDSKSKRFDPRDSVGLRLSLTDADGAPIKGDFSIAVSDSYQAKKSAMDRNILSYLLLESDLVGTIEEPGHYFKDTENQTLRDLDELMLSQGWRRFLWRDILAGRKKKIKYPIEYGLTLSGAAVNPTSGMPLPFTDLSFLILDDKGPIANVLRTDKLGGFKISGLNYADSTGMVFSLAETSKEVKKVKVLVNKQQYQSVGRQRRNQEMSWDKDIAAFLSMNADSRAIELAYGDKTKILKGVTIEGSKYEEPASIYGTPDAVITAGDRQYNDIFQMITGQVAGVNVYNNSQIRIRGSTGPPLIILDGVPLQSSMTGGIGNDGNTADSPNAVAAMITQANFGAEADILRSIPPSNVDRIEVLKGPSAAIYGVFGGNGVLVIYTKKGVVHESNTVGKKVFSLMLEGIYSARAFYAPDYGEFRPEHARPDRRSTLYWNPSVGTDDQGEAEVSFFNSDVGTVLQVEVQGISESGAIINELITIGK